MTRFQNNAAFALLILSLALITTVLAINYARSGTAAALPEGRCPVVEARYSPCDALEGTERNGR